MLIENNRRTVNPPKLISSVPLAGARGTPSSL